MNKSDYIAQKIGATIKIDGDISKSIWKDAAWSERFVDLVSGDPGMYNTQVAILWSDTHLYFAYGKMLIKKAANLIFLNSMFIKKMLIPLEETTIDQVHLFGKELIHEELDGLLPIMICQVLKLLLD